MSNILLIIKLLIIRLYLVWLKLWFLYLTAKATSSPYSIVLGRNVFSILVKRSILMLIVPIDWYHSCIWTTLLSFNWHKTKVRWKWCPSSLSVIPLVSTFIGRLTQRYITAQKTCDIFCQYPVNIFMKCLTLEWSLIMSGISKPYNNKSIIASQICFNIWLSSI